ncbi:MAG: galactose-1-phosphate uridylyltransferase [Bryobacteraceae bacterium]
MPELRQDPCTKEWVIMARERARRPDEFVGHTRDAPSDRRTCAFCPGNEHMTPTDIWRLTTDDQSWRIRVVPNKFPALSPEAGPEHHDGAGLYRRMDGYGRHEVIVETPDHDQILALAPTEAVRDVLVTFRERYQALRQDPGVKLVLIFKNHGPRAGTSMEHPHCQIIATPVIPSFIRRKYEVAIQHYDDTGRCIYCDIVRLEREVRDRVVLESDHFIVFEPYASRSPFETWIAPLHHDSSFGHVKEAQLEDLARILLQTLLRLHRGLGNPDFNFVVHTAPVEDETKPYYLWHFEITPRLTTPAGFELGSRISVNSCLPEDAAAFLRSVDVDG